MTGDILCRLCGGLTNRDGDYCTLHARDAEGEALPAPERCLCGSWATVGEWCKPCFDSEQTRIEAFR